ncbi:MAG: hypothetical protein IKQ18_05820 [Clostridia bacterium]|nr:hypothetical protein [Clostridia bacterium]
MLSEKDDIVCSKEEVFDLIGKYYGNPVYRYAVGKWKRSDLIKIKDFLDEINGFGYNFADLHRLTDNFDKRFVPVILRKYDEADTEREKLVITPYLMHKQYSEFTPDIVERYNQAKSSELKFGLSNVLYVLRNRKYIPLYMDLVNSDSYTGQNDFIVRILCQLHVKEFRQRFLTLYKSCPGQLDFSFAKYGYMIGDETYIPYLTSLCGSADKELCRYAEKSLTILKKQDEKK